MESVSRVIIEVLFSSWLQTCKPTTSVAVCNNQGVDGLQRYRVQTTKEGVRGISLVQWTCQAGASCVKEGRHLHFSLRGILEPKHIVRYVNDERTSWAMACSMEGQNMCGGGLFSILSFPSFLWTIPLPRPHSLRILVHSPLNGSSDNGSIQL